MNKIIYSVLAISIVFSSCKYEEGPGISLRTKRDRVSNEWKISKYEYTAKKVGTEDDSTAVDLTANYNIKNANFYTYFSKPNPLDTTQQIVDSSLSVKNFSYVFVLTRTGSYSLELVDGDNKGVDPRIMAQYVGEQTRGAAAKTLDPLNLFKIGRRGEWSFISKSSRLQLKPDNSGSNFTGSDMKNGLMVPVVFDIDKLFNDKMTLIAFDANKGKHVYELASFNPDKLLK